MLITIDEICIEWNIIKIINIQLQKIVNIVQFLYDESLW